MTIEADVVGPDVASARTFRFSRLMRRPPLLVHLTGFTLIVLIPALLFSAFLVLQFSQQQKEIAASRVADTAEIISDSIDREIYGMITAGKVLASSPFIDEADIEAFHERSIAALGATGQSAALVDQSLRTVADTRLTVAERGGTLSDLKAIEAAFRTRTPQISGAFFGQRSDDFVFHVAVPVFRGDRVIYVLAITRKTRDLTPIIADRNLPETWSAIIKDRAGHKVTAALASGGKMRAPSGMASDNPSLAETLGEGTSDDDLILASYSSILSGWVTTVAVPDAVIGRPIMRSWLLLVTTGLLLLVFCIGLAVFFGRRIAAPILLLADQAKSIGRGELALPVGTNIEEVGEVSKVLAQASRERREAEEQNRFLMREMSHRAKNQYALIAAIARRAAKESASTNEFLATLSEALSSLARSADLLAGRGWDSAALNELILTQLKAFGAGDGDQIELLGPAVQLNPTAAQTLGLALHELATNAAKYGALSVPDGYVRIRWSLDSRFAMSWSEIGGPPVVPPKRSGFGTLVTQKMTARGLGGEVEMDYPETGVVWTLSAPPEAVVAA